MENNNNSNFIILGNGLDRNIIKYIAIMAMLIDHIGMLFIPVTNPIGCIMRIVGRLTAALMCYFLAEGFYYTSNKSKYGIRLFIFAVISQPAYAFVHKNNITKIDFNVMFTFFVCFLILYSFEYIKNPFLKWICIVLLILASAVGDWGIFAPLMVLFFWIFRSNKNRQVLSYVIIIIIFIISDIIFCCMHGYHWYGELWQMGMFLVIPFIYLYNGKKGNGGIISKWIFYVFYPLHFIILGIIERLIL